MSDEPQEPAATRPPTTVAGPQAEPARHIGAYRLLEKIGEGGMGEVWLAEQQRPVRRRVALKVIKQGMDTRQVVARFEAERQALALMNHPAIAKVYEAGATPRGRPYFVMEHVSGVPITDYCDRNKLTNRERLELFRKVCDGVQHAHHKAVIHRDLKPSNVLVSAQDGPPAPKIIDFGVAKATAQKLTDKTVHTQLGVLIGTPAYMSPEQAEMTGEDVDTRTDVYALGVMLYELLVGALPFEPEEFVQGGLEGIVRKIREDDPPRPSIRLTTLGERSTESARRRRTDLPALRRELSGDLDAIVMKALEKDRTRRYDSPSQLAQDIGRFLAHEPVLATPPSRTYQLRKFARRNRALVGSVAATFLVLVAGVVVASVLAVREAAQRRAAEEARRDFETVVEFQSDMLGEIELQELGAQIVSDLRQRVGEAAAAKGLPPDEVAAAQESFDLLMRDVNATNTAVQVVDAHILDRAARTAEKRLAGRPLIEAQLRSILGETYLDLGLLERAESHLRAGLEVLEARLGRDDPRTLNSMGLLSQVLEIQGKPAEAEDLVREVIAALERTGRQREREMVESLNTLAGALADQGNREEAEAVSRRAVALARETLQPDDPDLYSSLNNRAIFVWQVGRVDEAAALFRDVLAYQRRTTGDDHPYTWITMNNLAMTLKAQGEWEEAVRWLRQVVEGISRVRGDDHWETLTAVAALGTTLSEMGAQDEAEGYLRRAMESYRRTLGDDHDRTILAINKFGEFCLRRGRIDEAESLLREALAHSERALGPDHPYTIMSLANVGWVLREKGELAEAETYYRETLERRLRVLGEEDPQTLRALWQVARLRFDQDDPDECVELARRAVDVGRRALPPNNENLTQSVLYLGLGLLGRGEYEAAEPLLRASLEKFESTVGSWYVGQARSALGAALVGEGRCEEARPLLLRARDELVAGGAPPLRVENAERRIAAAGERCGPPG